MVGDSMPSAPTNVHAVRAQTRVDRMVRSSSAAATVSVSRFEWRTLCRSCAVPNQFGSSETTTSW